MNIYNDINTIASIDFMRQQVSNISWYMLNIFALWVPSNMQLIIRGPFHYDLIWIPAWISNYMPSSVWDEITYPYWD